MASYEKLTLVLLGLVLVWHNVRAGYAIQALSLVLTMRAVLKESSSESVLLLMPFLFLGERCLNATLALGHSPLPFYSAALFSYTASFPRSGTWPMYYWCAFGAGSGGLLAVLTGKPTLAIGLLAQFVVGGLTIFACSRDSRSADDSTKSSSSSSKALTSFGHKNRREVLLVASIVASLVLDVFANSNVGTDLVQDSDASGGAATNGASIANQLKLTQITSFTHIAGRTSLVCACIITLVAAVLFPLFVLAHHPQLPPKPRCSLFLRSVLFLMVCVGIVGSAGLYVSSIMEENALLWLWAYLHSRKLRLYALLLWVTGIPLAVLGFHLFASKS
ncbi:dolichol kinase, putative, partial [Bodo saltans]